MNITNNLNDLQSKYSARLRGILGLRRWVQCSVYLLVILAVGITIVLARRSSAARSQRAAVLALNSFGAHLEYDFEELGLRKPSGWPAWVINGVGIDYFANVVTVDRFSDKTGDADLVYIQDLPNLRQLDLGNTQVTDTGLTYIRECKDLEYLNLRQTEITDGGLAQLQALATLTTLDISDDAVSDLGLASLQRLTKLQSLYINGTRIHDDGLVYIRGFTSLISLDLSNTDITDSGLRHLGEMKSIKFLDLRQTRITDSGLAHLGKIRTLETLDLSSTQITDRGLVHLKYLTALGKLVLTRTAASDAGVALLQRALPHCDIVYGSPKRISSIAKRDDLLAAVDLTTARWSQVLKSSAFSVAATPLIGSSPSLTTPMVGSP